jgi:hypothetical protein
MTAIPAHTVERVTKSRSYDQSHLGTSTSPKVQELRARYEAIQAAANANANFEFELKKNK